MFRWDSKTGSRDGGTKAVEIETRRAMEPDTIEPFLKVQQLAALTGLPSSWWYARAESGQVPHYKCGKYLRFRWSEIERYLSAQRKGVK